ncbi:MAG: cyanophycinase, partial [Bacteroidota bacterium]
MIVFALLYTDVSAQSFTSFFTGDTTDIVTTNHLPGTVLAGGGPDSDEAMQWMLARASGGDVVVLRASGSDGYNDYFFSDLGINVNSVETIRFESSAAAAAPYVIRRIREAEVLFLAGGDQSVYVDYWRNSPVAEAINFLVSEKRITIGGTSAGMAILGGAYYAPVNQSLISEEAVADPYHPNTQGISNESFLHLPYLQNVITDTHFENRNRQGRSIVFIARAAELINGPALGIACNEATAVCIDETGQAQIFGSFPDFPDFAFFLQPGCTNTNFGPENMTAGELFDWNRGGRAVSVYRLAGTPTGENTFNLNDWQNPAGGFWFNWYVAEGTTTFVSPGEAPIDCSPVSTEDL